MRLEAALAKLKAMEDELAVGNLRSPSDNGRPLSDNGRPSPEKAGLVGGIRLVGLAATQATSSPSKGKEARRASARVEELERQLTGLMTASEVRQRWRTEGEEGEGGVGDRYREGGHSFSFSRLTT